MRKRNTHRDDEHGLESNVSHFLVRGTPQFPPTPEGQLAHMFKQEHLDNEWQQRLDQVLGLLEQATDVACRIAESVAIFNEGMARLQSLTGPATEPKPDEVEPEYRSVLRPSDWAYYASFRASLIEAEADVRRADRLKPTDRVLKWKVAGAAGVSLRQLSRIQEHFGLDPKTAWPPSNWPETQPHKLTTQARLFAHVAVAAAVIGFCVHKIDPANVSRLLVMG